MNGPRRTAPLWFRRELRAISPRLTVEWKPEKQRWLISEAVPWAVRLGRTDGADLYRIVQRGQRVVWAEELGSKILEWIRRVKISRFTSKDQLMKELDVESSDYGRGLSTYAS